MRVSHLSSRPLVPLLLGWMVARGVLPDVSFAAPPDLAPAVGLAVDSAVAVGLPEAPLVTKAREGRAKGVSEARVVAAITDLAGRMQKADAALGTAAQGSNREAVLVAGAAAVRAGVSPEAIHRLGRVDQDVRAEGLRATADLVALGFDEDRSVELVLKGAASPAAARAVGNLGATAATLLAQGQAPSAVLDQMGQSIASVQAAEQDPPAWGAGGSKGKDPPGKGLDDAPGQQKK